ncbi:hypothetical protein PGTUg99_030033 [Puccinia graminis f. sp. tritici]|uniref:Uncharacterized protein n=1 Tax=Puccinia graminis f. sp. tritici TaxID=56615 RepID=A0A5B0PNA1_PUCGR|nr:hypothetical protein PGTUg99_030033 [Puccinia graminis f. sp. tritici]
MHHFMSICILSALLATLGQAITCLHPNFTLTDELAPPCRTIFICACGQPVMCMRQREITVLRCAQCGNPEAEVFIDQPCTHQLTVCPGHQ